MVNGPEQRRERRKRRRHIDNCAEMTSQFCVRYVHKSEKWNHGRGTLSLPQGRKVSVPALNEEPHRRGTAASRPRASITGLRALSFSIHRAKTWSQERGQVQVGDGRAHMHLGVTG